MATLRERILARLGINTTDFDRGISRARQNLQRFSNLSGLGRGLMQGMGLGLATAGLESMIGLLRQSARGIAQVGDEARRAGLDVEVFQELSYVARQNRIEVDALVDGIKELNLRADEWVTTGGGSAAEAFRRLGYSAQDLGRRLERPDELFLDIIGRMEDLDRAAQIRLADEVFGGTGGERFVQLIGQGQSGIRQLMREARDAGAVIDSALIDRAAEVDRRWEEVSTQLGARLNAIKVAAAEAATGLMMMAEDGAAAVGERLEARTPTQDLMDQIPNLEGIIGPGAMSMLRDGLQLTEDQIIAVRNLASSYQDVTGEVEGLISQLASAADEAMFVGRDEDARRLRAYAEQLRIIVREYDAGRKSGEDFELEIGGITLKATTLIAELNQVDDTDFDGVISRLGSLGTALGRAAQIAMALRTALTPVTVQMSQRDRVEAQEGRLNDVSVAPVPVSPGRPEARPTGYWEPWNEPFTDGGGSGGGVEAVSAYARAVAETREEIAELTLETTELISATGRDLPNAADFARRRTELLIAAQADGQEVTAELSAEIDALAMSYANAGQEAEAAADRIEDMQDNANRGADAAADLFMSIRGGAGSAREAVMALLAQIAQVQMVNGLRGLSGGGGPLAVLGSLLKVDGNAQGTTHWEGGISMVGELGAELVSMPRGSQVYSRHDTGRMLAEAVEKSSAAPARIEVVPSPYFDVRVDDRAGRITGAGMQMQARGARAHMMSQEERYG